MTAKTVLIATGGRPWIPDDVEGGDLGITSNEAFHLTELPKCVMVVGGGYIAVEFAGIFNGLGSRTVLVHRGDEILRGFDREVRERMRHELQKRGIDVHREDQRRVDPARGRRASCVRLTRRDRARGRRGDVRRRPAARTPRASGSSIAASS